jgi:hypothetical protein
VKPVLVGLALFSVFVLGIWAIVRDQDGYEQRRRDQMREANFICGQPPAQIIVHHPTEFPGDQWIEVRCQDGTSRSVAFNG